MSHEKNTLEPMEVMLQRQLAEAQRKIELMRQLGTLQGFFQAWFRQLEHSRTHEEAFDSLNDQYFELYGVYRYDSYNSFKYARHYHQRKNNIR